MVGAGQRAGGGDSVCAIVVTYNRVDMLRRCLQALRDQDRAPEHVLVVDNASTDDTAAVVTADFPEFELLTLPENVGGAGGFHCGMNWAYEQGFDWLWLMDDDTMVVPKTLDALLAGAARAPGGLPLVVASQVRWKDETLHPMNRPVPRWRRPADMALGLTRGLILLRNATFVSVAIRREAIDRFGLPLAHYFIWTDDVEYTSRVLFDEPGYLVPESSVYHWTPTAHTAVTNAGARFYFHVRNSLLLLRGSSLSTIERLDYLGYYVRTLRDYVRDHGRSRASWAPLLRGLRDGVRDEVR